MFDRFLIMRQKTYKLLNNLSVKFIKYISLKVL